MVKSASHCRLVDQRKAKYPFLCQRVRTAKYLSVHDKVSTQSKNRCIQLLLLHQDFQEICHGAVCSTTSCGRVIAASWTAASCVLLSTLQHSCKTKWTSIVHTFPGLTANQWDDVTPCVPTELLLHLLINPFAHLYYRLQRPRRHMLS
jgi:hypothetical protein